MGFIRGVIAGIAVAAGAAAWYMSRAGSAFRERTRVDRRLGQLGDEIEERTRDVRSKVAAQVDEARSSVASQVDEAVTNVRGGKMADTLDEARAAAAEEAAEIAADVEAKAAKVKRAAKDEAASTSDTSASG
jgi:hypothetical protein